MNISNSMSKYSGCGKLKYSAFYTRYFTHRSPKFLFEIGVYKGDSLRVWQDFFPHCKIVGLDINEEAKVLAPEFEVYVGNQRDTKLLDKIFSTHGLPDIIIDDGGHTRSQQITSLAHIFPKMSPDSLYIIEDMQVNYTKPWNDQPLSTYDYLMNLIKLPNSKSGMSYRSIIFESTICMLVK